MVVTGGTRAIVQQNSFEAEASDVLDDIAVRFAVEPDTRFATRADEARQLQQY